MNTPLVTVGVVTYNSAEFIEETLDSIYNQDYQNIELIVSDDCSIDNTVEICKEWISKHELRFNRAKLVTSEKNTGVSGNSNRALHEAHGEWYKCFDGDDILAPQAISSYVRFSNNHPCCSHVVAKSGRLNENLDKREKERDTFNMINKFYCREYITAERQHETLCKLFFVSCITYFAKTELIRNVGGFDERFPLREDYPLIIKTTGTHNKLFLMDDITAFYRVRKNSISHLSSSGAFFSRSEVTYIMDYKLLYRLENLKGIWKLFHYYSITLNSFIICNGNSKKNLFCWILWVVRTLTDPFVWYRRFVIKRVRLWYKFSANEV